MELIVEEIQEVQEFVSVHRHFQFATLKPHLTDATEQLIQFLSQQEYDKLLAAYQNSSFSSTAQSDLLRLCQGYICQQAFFLGLPHFRNHISEMGIQQSYQDSAGISRPATDSSVKALSLSFQKAAWKSSEKILAHLEKHAATFTDWVSSEAFTLNYDCLLTSTAQFKEHIHAVALRRTYLALKPYIRLVERRKIQSLLCSELYEDLKSYVRLKAQKQDVSAFPVAYEKLLEVLRPVIAYQSLLKALHFLELSLEGEQLYIAEYNTTTENRRATDYRRMEHLKQQLEIDAQLEEERLKSYLIENYQEFPLYENSSCYERLQPEVCMLPENEGRSNFMI